MNGWIVYDCEIKRGVVTENNPRLDGFEYAAGCEDFSGMGISVLCAYDILESRYRVFCDDNLEDFVAMARHRIGVIGFNNHRFDDKLLAEHGIYAGNYSLDIAESIWRAAGVPQEEHPKGLGLDAICKANGLGGKSASGADAPQEWQRGRIGRVIDYCLTDVRMTVRLLRLIQDTGGIIDPRFPGKRIRVDL